MAGGATNRNVEGAAPTAREPRGGAPEDEAERTAPPPSRKDPRDGGPEAGFITDESLIMWLNWLVEDGCKTATLAYIANTSNISNFVG